MLFMGQVNSNARVYNEFEYTCTYTICKAFKMYFYAVVNQHNL